MGDHAEFIADGIEHLLDTQGQEVIWWYPEKTSINGTLQAVVEPVTVEQRDDERGSVNRRVRGVLVRTTDLPLLNNTWPGATMRLVFSILSEDWQVEAIEQVSFEVARFRCVRTPRRVRARGGIEK